MIGETLVHYEITSQIGKGGMGEVYQAKDTKLGRDVAIKVLPEEFATDADRVARFQREAKLLAALNHPNIAAIYGLEESEGMHFLVLELIEGETLSDRLKRGPIPVEEALKLALQMAEALEAAHERGVIHRDLKPANIKVTPEGKVKILDFGLAKAYAGDQRNLSPLDSPTISAAATRQGVILGTPSYMSPEQARGQNVGPRSDIFNFGIIFYEILTGNRPFKASSSPEILNAIINTPAPPLKSSVKIDNLPDLQRICNKCLAKIPGERYQTVRSLVGDLRAADQRFLAQPLAGRYALEILRYLFKKPAVAVSTIAVLVLLVLLTGWIVHRNSRIRWARETALPEIEQFVKKDNYPDAFVLASQAERYIPEDSSLAEIWPHITQNISFRTEPDGAKVYFKIFSDTERKEEYLGLTPIEKIRLPRGPYWLRIEKDGYETIEDLLPGPGTYDLPETVQNIGFKLDPEGNIPSDMVRIPTSVVYMFLIIGFSDERPVLPSYFIDKHEVTNSDYKKFVDNGGYENPEYWEHEFIYEGRTLSFEEAMAKFRDRTGRPGPSTWEVGSFPEAEEGFPVSGVSWYEAAAYAKFAGKSLPTVYHWAGATDLELATFVVPSSNFGDRGLRAVAQGPVGPRGTYDMAGNVREWCWSAYNNQRLILGGSWNEPSYMYYSADFKSPFDRSKHYGFRCMQYLDGDIENQRSLKQTIQFPALKRGNEKPISDEAYEAYKSRYAYDPTDLESIPGPVDESSPYWTKQKITFRAAYQNERVAAYLFAPKNQAPPFQTVVYFPGANATLQRTNDNLQLRIIDFILKSGRAVMYPIYKGTYERYEPGLLLDRSTKTFADNVTCWINDLRRSIDYLETREDINMTRLAYCGFSWGAELGPIALALEKRLSAGIFLDGGLYLKKQRAEIDNLNFAPRVSAPVLMVNGKHDSIFPFEATQKPLFDLLGTPEHQKQHVLFDCGHAAISFFRNQVISDILDWLDTNFGKPQ